MSGVNDFKEQATKGFKDIQNQNNNLYTQNLQLMKDLSAVRQEIDFMKQERERKELLRNKRKNARKDNIRESITENEFFHILDTASYISKGDVRCQQCEKRTLCTF